MHYYYRNRDELCSFRSEADTVLTWRRVLLCCWRDISGSVQCPSAHYVGWQCPVGSQGLQLWKEEPCAGSSKCSLFPCWWNAQRNISNEMLKKKKGKEKKKKRKRKKQGEDTMTFTQLGNAPGVPMANVRTGIKNNSSLQTRTGLFKVWKATRWQKPSFARASDRAKIICRVKGPLWVSEQKNSMKYWRVA